LPALLTLVLGALLVLGLASPPADVATDAEHALAMVGERLAMGVRSGDGAVGVGGQAPPATSAAWSGPEEDGGRAEAAEDAEAELADGADAEAAGAEEGEEVDPADPTEVFAQVGDLALRLPSHAVVVHGFHEASNRTSFAMTPVGDEPRLLPSRGRPAPATSAVDIVLVDDEPVRSPVTGTVEVAESFHVYGKHPDRRIVLVPDDAPELRVVVLHVTGVAVTTGDRVEAGVSVLAESARRFPFRSQIDDETAPDAWPHVHYEVRSADEA
jgi:murein DD-endopeptidase MepM/ murein hydrolase activator NlpD